MKNDENWYRFRLQYCIVFSRSNFQRIGQKFHLQSQRDLLNFNNLIFKIQPYKKVMTILNSGIQPKSGIYWWQMVVLIFFVKLTNLVPYLHDCTIHNMVMNGFSYKPNLDVPHLCVLLQLFFSRNIQHLKVLINALVCIRFEIVNFVLRPQREGT